MKDYAIAFAAVIVGFLFLGPLGALIGFAIWLARQCTKSK